ncbi:hypothetical protein PHMEG_00011166 [Phytophthora megakarya]|uniref:Uncharacterized protein n=1 Tax=Phytophthora megakarya TaxID=4795 RepID=A0A225WDK6_9STRA|nr:hypothetical protein PHMEG_00011166 [Phytophthora megakarya]
MANSVSPSVRAVCRVYDADNELVLELIQQFFDVTANWSLVEAAERGHLELVKILDGDVSVALDFAAEAGNVDVVQWLHSNRTDRCTVDAMDMAAANGHLDMVQWLHDHREEGCSSDAMDLAATNGFLPVVKWLHHHRQEGCSHRAMDGAAANGHLEVVKWLHSHRDEGCSKDALLDACNAGQSDVAKWIMQFRSEGSVNAAINAAAQGSYHELVQWLVDHAFLRDTYTLHARNVSIVDSSLHYFAMPASCNVLAPMDLGCQFSQPHSTQRSLTGNVQEPTNSVWR